MSLSPSYPVFTRRKYTASLHDTQRSIDAASVVVRKLGTYLTIPSFSINATWRGASEIIAKFNFSLTANFTISRIIEQENFCACISWKPTSTTIVRYKLWKDVGEILYVPLYNGEKIGNNFSIEIWNIQPTNPIESSGFLIEEGAADFIIEEAPSADFEIGDFGDSGFPVELVSYNGSALITTSIMQLPESPFCNLSPISIGGIPPQCTDITFEVGDYVGSILDDFIPIDGDYYILDGICGETILVKGIRAAVELFKLQDQTDGTWHSVFVGQLPDDPSGELFLFVDQDPTTPGDAPFFTLRNPETGLGMKVYLDSVLGEYYMTTVSTGLATFDYSVLFMQFSTDYHRVRIGAEDSLYLDQTPVTI